MGSSSLIQTVAIVGFFMLIIGNSGENVFLFFDDELAHNLTNKMSDLNLSYKRLEQERSSQQKVLQTDVKAMTAQQDKLQESMRNIQQEMQKLSLDQQLFQSELKASHKAIQQDIMKIMGTLTNHTGSTKRPQSCAEAVRKSGGKSGVYLLHLTDAVNEPFYAYCLEDPKYGAAWTIIQRRIDNTTDFYRDWNEYKKGFGDVHKNYFLGLDKLHTMTYTTEHELWISMEDFEGEKRSAYYDSFGIGNEDEKYELKVLGEYIGDAGDSLTYHKGMQFSTKDVEHDLSKGICAQDFHGAWWYNSCFLSNLNGRYIVGEEANGIEWRGFKADYSLKYVHMAIRRKYV